MKTRAFLLIGAATTGLAMPGALAAGRVTMPQAEISAASTGDAAITAHFEPQPSGRTARINYELIDDALNLMVFNAGPSLRRYATTPDARVGSRFTKGHTSPYRLEGNKIFFSQFDDDTVAAIGEYRASLERIGSAADLTTLPRNEQLAYWFNLHNIVVIDEIAKAYPVTRPSRMKLGPDRETLHDAKIIEIDGIALSLRDIRENIVYRHWSDPKVIYGFYRGDLGSPSIRSAAYTADSVGDELESQAREFVNSLRGVARGRNKIKVSEVYAEARPALFPQWPSDFRSHLMEYAEEDVAELLQDSENVQIAQYEDTVGDMVGGDITSDLSPRDNAQVLSLPPQLARMANEYEEKILELKRQGYFKSKVIIIDEPTEDPDAANGEVD